MTPDTSFPAERTVELGADTAGTAQATCFEATTTGGPLRLRIDGVVRHAAQAVLLLERCHELIDALEDWIAAPLAFRWLATAPAGASQSHACAGWAQANGDAAAQIELPWMLLRATSMPPGAALHGLHWAEVPAVLVAAQLALDDEEIRLLEPGGAVVLPDSASTDAAGWLRAEDEPANPGRGVPVRLESAASARRIAGAAGANDSSVGEAAWYEVRVGVPRMLAGDRLAGWYEGDLGAVGAGASLWRCATETEPARPLATGRLMPWAEGWALALQFLCDLPPAGSVLHRG